MPVLTVTEGQALEGWGGRRGLCAGPGVQQALPWVDGLGEPPRGAPAVGVIKGKSGRVGNGVSL